MNQLSYLSIKQAHELLVSKEISATELVKYYLKRIAELDDKIQACLYVCEEEALAQAKKLDEKIAGGEKIRLFEGIPYTAKDMFLTRGIPTTAASKILEGFMPPYSASAISALKAAGAILIAKLNQDEFAHGGSTENSGYHATKNPWDLARVPGGSSGGSAAAVAADFGIFSLGTDTGGSIRQPASYCGVTGLKPTYGLVSRYGVVAMASSFDCIGPIARSAEDAAQVLQVIAGRDNMDSTTIELEEYRFSKDELGNEPKIALAKNEENSALDLEIIKSTHGEDGKLPEFELPLPDLALAAYYVLVPSEISSNLERYDGIRYGQRARDAANLLETYTKTRGEFLGAEVKRRILTGTYALSAGFYDAYYNQAMKVRALIAAEYAKLFESYDLLLMPTVLGPAFEFGEKSDPIEMYRTDVLTVSANLAGLPAVSIPAGIDQATGMPLGLQIVGRQGEDGKVLALARQYQEKTTWHKKVEELKI